MIGVRAYSCYLLFVYMYVATFEKLCLCVRVRRFYAVTAQAALLTREQFIEGIPAATPSIAPARNV